MHVKFILILQPAQVLWMLQVHLLEVVVLLIVFFSFEQVEGVLWELLLFYIHLHFEAQLFYRFEE